MTTMSRRSILARSLLALAAGATVAPAALAAAASAPSPETALSALAPAATPPPDAGLLQLFDEYQAARSNICGEQFKKLEDFLLRPALPMRIIECRAGYKANVIPAAAEAVVAAKWAASQQ